MMQRLISITLLLLICISSSHAEDAPLLKGIRNYDIGIAPVFTLNDIDGKVFNLMDTRGSWVFLHFWASWCGPCIKEMPTIEKLISAIESDKFKVVMVNTAEDEDTIFTFLGSIGVAATSLIDGDGLVTEKYKPRGLPTTIIIDPSGHVRYQAIGGREWDKQEYIGFIKQLFNKTE